MIQRFLQLAGVNSEAEFYKKYPTEEVFLKAHPQLQAGGFADPWQVVHTQPVPQRPDTGNNLMNFPAGPTESAPLQARQQTQQSVNPTFDLSKGFQAANSIMDFVGGIKTQFDNERTAKEERQKMYELTQPISYSNPNQYGSGNGVLSQAGGYFDTGANNSNPNVVAEQNEMYEKDGQVYHIAPGMPGAQRHEDGGTPVNAERVLEATSTMQGRDQPTDKLLKVNPDTAKALTGFRPDKTLSHATAMKKADEYWTAKRDRYIRKADKILNNSSADKYALESARMNMMQAQQMPSTQQLFDALFNHQEAIKMFHGIGNEANYAAGGAQTGGYINTNTRNDWNNFINFLKSRSLSGNTSLDNGGNPSSRLMDMYHQANPDSHLNPQIIPRVQQDFIDHRQAYDRTNLPMSKQDGWVGSITSTYQYPQGQLPQPQQPAAQPVSPQGSKRSLHYEKLYDRNGKMIEYAPVFEGNWTHNDVQNYWKDIPDSFNGVPVARGQAWAELWNGFRPGTIASQWTKAGDRHKEQVNSTMQSETRPVVAPAQVIPHKSKIKVSYDAAAMQAGGQPNRKEFQLPFQWMQDVPLFDMLTLSKAPVNYNEPQAHDVQLQGYNATSAINRINTEYKAAVNSLPSGGTSMAMQAQLFANKEKAIGEEMDRVGQYNTGISNQNALYHQQYENQAEQYRANALQNFGDRINKRNAVFDTQKQADRDQWMHNLMNSWATDFAINKLMPQMYPYYNYDGTPTGKQWHLSMPGVNGNNEMMDSKGRGYELVQKPELVKKKRMQP